MTIGPANVAAIFRSNAEVADELNTQRQAAADPKRPRMVDNLPGNLKDLEELLYLVRVNDEGRITGLRRYWLSLAMLEVERLRNSSSERFRRLHPLPVNFNGKAEEERYDYAREMLDEFVKANRPIRDIVLEKTIWVILAIFLGGCLLTTMWLFLSGVRAMIWEVAEKFWGLVAFAILIGLIGLVKLGWSKFVDHHNSTAWKRRQ